MAIARPSKACITEYSPDSSDLKVYEVTVTIEADHQKHKIAFCLSEPCAKKDLAKVAAERFLKFAEVVCERAKKPLSSFVDSKGRVTIAVDADNQEHILSVPSAPDAVGLDKTATDWLRTFAAAVSELAKKPLGVCIDLKG